jgi:hypothetical protein
MDVKSFAMEVPYICDAENPEQWAWINGKVFDEELNNKNSVFARNNNESNPTDRLKVAFAFTAYKHNESRTNHCKKLFELMLLNHYKKEHGENQWDDRIVELQKEIKVLEPENTDISVVMDTEMALQSWWDKA